MSVTVDEPVKDEPAIVNEVVMTNRPRTVNDLVIVDDPMVIDDSMTAASLGWWSNLIRWRKI